MAGSKETTDRVPRPELMTVWYVRAQEAALATVGAGEPAADAECPTAGRTISEGSQSEAFDDSMTASLAAVATFCAAAVALTGKNQRSRG